MVTESVYEHFESSLAALEVDVTRTDPAGFEATIETVAEEPAIGIPLPIDGVSLPDWIDTEPTPATLESANTGITAASFAIADYGSVVLPATPEGSEQVSLFPRLHVAVVEEREILPDMRTAIDRIGPLLRTRESVIIATGPSATADMGDLVRGAHGPEEVHVVVVGDGSGVRDRSESDATEERR